MNARLFLALWPGVVSRNAAAAVQRAMEWPENARPAAPAGLHVTVHFIGQVRVERVKPLADALAMPTGQYQLKLEQIEVWRGGIAVLTPSQVPQSLLDLHGRLGDVLEREGISLDERPYRPHVTLARRADIHPDRLARPIVWRSTGYALVLSSGGAYTPIRRYGPESAA